MKPGQELDMAIAEKVMGFKDIRKGTNSFPPFEEYMNGVQFFGSDDVPGELRPIPPYSSDIKAAWEVWEKCFEKDQFALMYHHEFGYGVGDGAYANYGTTYSHGIIWAPTAPLAIALAALKAVGVELP